ncbi:hypothetical protein OAB62_03890 [Pseudomonadales bacterium]|nr:hypothetical protein [Pseudomonadales bacterium]
MHGGKREGAGRPAGMPNKATIEQGARLAELAKSYSDIAFNTLVDVAINGTSDSARIAAANSILDRGYGKPKSDGGLSLRHFKNPLTDRCFINQCICN